MTLTTSAPTFCLAPYIPMVIELVEGRRRSGRRRRSVKSGALEVPQQRAGRPHGQRRRLGLLGPPQLAILLGLDACPRPCGLTRACSLRFNLYCFYIILSLDYSCSSLNSWL
jgi:hypothetical protein